MQIYPALDLRDQRIVRLYQGDFNQVTFYPEQARDFIRTLEAQSLEWLHIVDLDAAKNPKQTQRNFIAQLVKQTSLKVQVGGGIRTAADIEVLLSMGVARVVIGSLAVREPETVMRWLEQYGPERIVLAFDVQADETGQMKITTHAWQAESAWTLWQGIEYYQSSSLQHLLCTDIQCDGTLQGPNFALYTEIKARYPELHIQASGGVHAITDITALQQLGVAAVIVGKALHEKKLDLQEALEVLC